MVVYVSPTLEKGSHRIITRYHQYVDELVGGFTQCYWCSTDKDSDTLLPGAVAFQRLR